MKSLCNVQLAVAARSTPSGLLSDERLSSATLWSEPAEVKRLSLVSVEVCQTVMVGRLSSPNMESRRSIREPNEIGRAIRAGQNCGCWRGWYNMTFKLRPPLFYVNEGGVKF